MSTIMVGTKKAAEELGVSVSTVYRMIDKGILHPFKTPGGQRRFDIGELEAFKETSKTIVAPQTFTKARLSDVKEPDIITEESSEQPDSETTIKTKSVDKRNNLNDLNGSQWLPETKSFFFQKGLGSNHPHAQIERQHPAPYSYQDVEHIITFFTKKGMSVLDPFGGVGSTAKACELEGRVCTSI